MKPLMFDFFCGLGGATQGFLAEGWECIGVDNERHDYGKGGYPGHLLLQDILTFHGSQARFADFLWFSPPCQAFSWMAMPWSLAKKKAAEIREDYWKWYELTRLFVKCFEIQLEASRAAGRHIPMIVENVRGAQSWVGRSKWRYGSFHLWGDVPALMPMTNRAVKSARPNREGVMAWTTGHLEGYWKSTGNAAPMWKDREDSQWNASHGLKLPGNNAAPRWEDREVQRLGDATKGLGSANQFRESGGSVKSQYWTNIDEYGNKGNWLERDKNGKRLLKGQRAMSSGSNARKAASAQIAMIPLPLSRWIARVFKP